tara:strand:+ start:7185 stop:8630 length:1446 start_codon:yes stop_codon:yes gene_type:complete
MAITGAINVTPAPTKDTPLAGAYIDFQTATWAQQYLPDLMEKEAEVFGNRTISGFLQKVGAEEAMSADQVVWSEQGRLHLSYSAVTTNGTGAIKITRNADGRGNGGANSDLTNHGVRAGDLVLVATTTATIRAFVISVGAQTSTGTCTIQIGKYASGDSYPANAAAVKVLVFGSEYVKGSVGRDSINEPGFKSLTNNPIIIKDKYQVSGSDASQIGWVEVSGEDNQNGYLWYLKAQGDTRARFGDYLEMALIESVKRTDGDAAATQSGAQGTMTGTEGLFAAMDARGNKSSGVTGVNAATDLAEFDAILAEFDKNGAIEENMMFLNRGTALAIDDMLASMNSYGAGGTSYGVFDNSEDMAMNLGFSGFRRGSYDFYKSDWKYLNDQSTRGIINDFDTTGAIRGIMVPAGTSSVYDQSLGKNIKRPFLHVRYRASKTESRKYKTWITDSVGAVTSDLDAMTVNYLSERCLIVQGANNFMMFN